MPQNAIDVLTQEHRKAEQLLEQLQLGGDEALLQQVAEELTVHMQIEEQVLYPFIRSNVPEGSELMNEAEKEHGEAKQALQQVLSAEFGSDQFTQALNTLIEGVQHHVEEEETQVFPKLQESVEQAQLEEFGEELTQTKQQLMGGQPPAEEKTRDELYAEAKEIGIEGRSKMDKEELAQAVEHEQG